MYDRGSPAQNLDSIHFSAGSRDSWCKQLQNFQKSSTYTPANAKPPAPLCNLDDHYPTEEFPELPWPATCHTFHRRAETMRSRALQALRPIRVASPAISPSVQYLRTLSRRSPILKQLARAASSSSYTVKPRTASSTPVSRARAAPVTKAATSPRVNAAPSSAVNGVIDPQAAIPQAATIADVDPALAAQIPTTETPGSAPSAAFTAALSGSANGGNGNGNGSPAIDWSSSFHGLSTTPFSPETAAQLMEPLDPLDIEIKPDGIIYLPEIKYRRILNKAFGPGGWGLAPRGELVVGEKVVTREYALVVHGRYDSLGNPLARFHILTSLRMTASSPKPAVSASTSPRRRSRPPARGASRTRCCAAAKTWASPRSCGTRASSASSRSSTARRSGSSTSSTRSAARSGRARMASRPIPTRRPRASGCEGLMYGDDGRNRQAGGTDDSGCCQVTDRTGAGQA